MQFPRLRSWSYKPVWNEQISFHQLYFTFDFKLRWLNWYGTDEAEAPESRSFTSRVPCAGLTFCSWQEAVQKLIPSLELFSKPAGKKMPLATVVPVQLYYFCSNKYKKSLLNKTFIHMWNISKEKASIAVSCHSYGSEMANEELETPFTAAIAWKEELHCLPVPVRTRSSECVLKVLPEDMLLSLQKTAQTSPSNTAQS